MRGHRQAFQKRSGKQNIFRVSNAGRINIIWGFITGLLFSLSSYPSYIVEVFLRKKFGERYYTTANAILITFVMIYIWFSVHEKVQDFLGFTWLIFTAIFLWKSIRHRMEITKFGTAYNYDRFSYSDGQILSFWWDLIGTEILGIKVTRYHVLILFEPALPVLAGLILMIIPFTRGTGILIFLSGLLFGFRSFMKAHMARGYVLDIIDEQICMEGKHDVLVEEKPKSEAKGLSLPIELPKSREIREELSNSLDNHNPLDIWDDE